MKEKKSEIIKFFLRRYPYRSALALVALFITGILDTLGILTLLPILNFALSSSNQNNEVSYLFEGIFDFFGVDLRLENLLIVLVFIFLIKSMILSITRRYIRSVTADVALDLQKQIFHRLLNAKWSFFVNTQSGHFVNAIVSEAPKCAAFYLQWCMLCEAILNLILLSAAMAFTSWKISLVAGIVGVFIIVVFKGFIKSSKESGKQVSKLAKDLSNNLADAVQGAKMLKAMNKVTVVIENLNAEASSFRDERFRQNAAKDHVDTFREPIIIVVFSVALYLAVVKFSYPVTELMVLFSLFYRAINNWGVLQGNYQAINAHEGYFWSLTKLLKTAEEHEEIDDGKVRAFSLEEGIKLKNISFSYAENKVIDNFEMVIEKGRITSLIGASGSGKTTIADLLIRLYKPDSGDIIADETSIFDLSLSAWRKNIGYISQDPILFHRSIRDNITFGDVAVSEDDINRALDLAEASAFVRELENGLDTIVGERGARLSGGQRQRLSIARALVRKPELLILDEATTALDPKTEQEVCATLKKLAGDITIFAISHQEAIVNISDVVYEIKDRSAIKIK